MAEIRDIKSGRSGEPPREPAPRRLAAIVAGDISGYSRLMQIDEQGTHSRVKRIERELIEPSIAEHHGRLVKTTGDGFIAIFDSPSKPCGAVSLSSKTWLDATPRCPSIIGSNIGSASISATSSSKLTMFTVMALILRPVLRGSLIPAKFISRRHLRADKTQAGLRI